MTYPRTHPNGLAYPSVEANADGLTKREWFTGMELQGILSSPSMLGHAATLATEDGVTNDQMLGSMATSSADAAIAALNLEQDDES